MHMYWVDSEPQPDAFVAKSMIICKISKLFVVVYLLNMEFREGTTLN